jgi:hypothetical protein
MVSKEKAQITCKGRRITLSDLSATLDAKDNGAMSSKLWGGIIYYWVYLTNLSNKRYQFG